jgi:hypothetical protein
MLYRPRLWHIKTERDLRKYFEKHAGYMENQQCYHCAGIVSDDTHILWQKLVKEWREDKKQYIKDELKKDA